MSSDSTYEKKEYKEYEKINNNSDVVNIYYDISITNNNTGFNSSGTAIATVAAVPCTFSQNRQIPYLNNN